MAYFAKMGEVVVPHKGLSCDDNQLFHGPQIASHVHKIEAQDRSIVNDALPADQLPTGVLWV